MKHWKYILYIVLFSFGIKGYAQQDPQFTQWMFDRVSFNPAFAGSNRMHCVQSMFRTQWVGFSQNPNTGLFNYHGYIPLGESQHYIGIGLTGMQETLGLETNTMLRLSGAYSHNVGSVNIAGGFQVGMMQKQLGTSWIYIDQGDPIVNDLLTNNKAQSAFDASVGAAVFNKKFYVGVSATHLTAADLAELNYKMARHIYFMGGYNHDISSDITLRTNLLVKSDLHASPAMDLNVNALWKNMLWGGLSYRFGDAIAPMAGFQKIFNPIVSGRTTYEHVFRIGYSYDMTTSSIKDYSQGSHEIMVSYCFNITREPPKTISVNPRFL